MKPPSGNAPQTKIIRRTLLDENFLEFTEGRPLPVYCADQHFFSEAIENDTSFLAMVKVVDYSILVGVDEVGHYTLSELRTFQHIR